MVVLQEDHRLDVKGVVASVSSVKSPGEEVDCCLRDRLLVVGGLRHGCQHDKNSKR